MTETKAKRLIVAGTVGAVLLAVILLSVMVYQLISISVYNKRIETYNQKSPNMKGLLKTVNKPKKFIPCAGGLSVRLEGLVLFTKGLKIDEIWCD